MKPKYHHLYILKDGKPVPCSDMMQWAAWFEDTKKRVVKQTNIGDVLVSTVFLGTDHSFGGKKPVLWETMIFRGKHDNYQRRYTSRKDAVAGHREAVKLAKKDA